MKRILVIFLLIVMCATGLARAAEMGTYAELVEAIRAAKIASRARIEEAVAQEKVREAWEIGKLIDTHILQHKERADYGKEVIPRLSRDLSISERELYYMLAFAREYPILRLAAELSWSHYEALLDLKDPAERKELTEQAVREGWTRRQLRAEVRKKNSYTEQKEEPLAHAAPGPVYTYRVIAPAESPFQGKPALDLGFSTYHAPAELTGKFKAGDIITAGKDGLKKLENGTDADLYTYAIDGIEVIDGDTLKATVDLGFDIVTVQTLRLRGIDAPEIESKAGMEAKTFLEERLQSAKEPILIRSVKSDKYDRYLIDLFIGEEYINQELLDQGYADII